ncbi:hypothetical protein MUCCIDRAFT_118892, partial [Mucor lusitanicus CBS 277.49]
FLERLGLCESIGVTPSEFLDFLVDVDHGYLPNAYHSFYHAVDVAVVLYHMVCQYDVASYISRIDIAALMIAGLCHDIGHPGKNNNFQVNLKTDLAIRYSNKSVLESYSCTITMDLLTKHKLLRRLEKASGSLGLPTSESEMRTGIIKMILATDMIFHYELQENLANLLEIITDENPQQRLILCQIILHAADISNALRPWPICLSWSNLVCEEFFLQGDAEQEHGLKVSPNMDRNQVSQTTIGLQFGDFVVSPYFEIFAALFPKADELLKELAANRVQW